MKILMVHDDKQINGGSGQVAADEIELLKKNNHNVYFFTFSGPNNFSKINIFPFDRKNQITYLEPKNPSISFLLQSYFSFRLYRAFKKTIKQVKPDIIHLHEVRKGTASIILAAKHSGIPIVQTLHDTRLACMSEFGLNRKTGVICLKGSLLHCLKNNCAPFSMILKYGILWKMTQWLDKHYIQALLCPSKFVLKTVSKLGYKNLQYLPHFPSLKNKNSKIASRGQILCVGRLVEIKGIIDLIKAFEIIVKKYPDLKLILIGRGSEKENLQIYIKEHHVKNISLIDTIPHKKLNRYYRKSFITILPSIGNENCPLSILESFSCGTPVVASNIGGIPELVKDNITGMLFKPGDYVDLSSKILYLLSNQSLLKKMRINCLETIKSSYNGVGHYKSLMTIYKSVLKSQRNYNF